MNDRKPRRLERSGPRILAALAIAALAWLSAPVARTDAAAQGFTKSVDDRAVYYRVVAKLMHGDEAVDFDIVVACGVRTIRTRDGDRSVFSTFTPLVFGQKTKAGHVVSMRVPDACRGETSDNGRVPATWMPEFVWFDDAADMRFGLGYFSEAAYEHPKAQLRFVEAAIRRATRVEWEGWARERGAANAIDQAWVDGRPMPRRPSPELVRDSGWKLPHDYYGHFPTVCRAMMKLRLTEEGRAVARAAWPEHRPRFWVKFVPAGAPSPISAFDQEFGASVDGTRGPSRLIEGRRLSAYRVDPFKRWGLPRRAGGAQIEYRDTFIEPPMIIPIRSEMGLPWLEPALATAAVIHQDLDSSMIGFHYCYSDFAEAATAARVLLGADWRGPKGRTFSCRVDGVLIEGYRDCYLTPSWFFENDEFLYLGYWFRY